MRSRRLNKRIEVWQISKVADGYGGFNVIESKMIESWANIKTLQPGKQYNLTDFGLVDSNNTIIITTRKRNDLVYNVETLFVKYRDVKYTIATAPTNINFNDNFIVFIGVAETTKNNTISQSSTSMYATGMYATGMYE